jgi:hypothetical protein
MRSTPGSACTGGRYVSSISKELSAVPTILKEVAALSCVRVFAFDDEMLHMANQFDIDRKVPAKSASGLSYY